jgi:hypothetical protein
MGKQAEQLCHVIALYQSLACFAALVALAVVDTAYLLQ